MTVSKTGIRSQPKALPGEIQSLLRPLRDLIQKQKLDLDRQGRDGLRQGNLALLASEYEKTMVDAIEKKLVYSLIFQALSCLTQEELEHYVANKVDCKSAIKSMVHFSLVQLADSYELCSLKVRYFTKDGSALGKGEKKKLFEQMAQNNDEERCWIKISSTKKQTQRKKNVDENLPKHIISGVPLLWLQKGFESIPVAQDLLLVLSALVEKNDALIFFVPARGSVYGLPPPLDYTVEEADQTWNAWAKLVCLTGEALLKCARSKKVAAPADARGGKVYRQVVETASKIINQWKTDVCELHPNSDLVAWPLSTRSSQRTTQLTFSGLLLLLVAKKRNDDIIISSKQSGKYDAEAKVMLNDKLKNKCETIDKKNDAYKLRDILKSARGLAYVTTKGIVTSTVTRNLFATTFRDKLRTTLLDRIDKTSDYIFRQCIVATKEDFSLFDEHQWEKITIRLQKLIPKLQTFIDKQINTTGHNKRMKQKDVEYDCSPMDCGHDFINEKRCFNVELIRQNNDGSFDEIRVEDPRTCSSKDNPDKTLLSDLRIYASTKWGLDETTLKCGSFYSKTPSFQITNSFFWDSTNHLIVEFVPFSLSSFTPHFSLGPGVSYGRRFTVFNTQAIHDLWRRTLQGQNILHEVFEVIAQKLMTKFERKLELPVSLVEDLKANNVFSSTNKTDKQMSETRAAILLMTSSQTHMIVKACSKTFYFAAIQTNGYEYRMVYNCQGFEKEKKNARTKEKDIIEAERIQKFNKDFISDNAMTDNIEWVGCVGIDGGMSGLDINQITNKEVNTIINARAYVLNQNKMECDIDEHMLQEKLELPNESNGVLNFKTQTNHFSVKIGQLQSERQTKTSEKKAKVLTEDFMKNLPEVDKKRLSEVGGLQGDTDLTKVPLSKISDAVNRIVGVLDLRMKHYRHEVFAERKFFSRKATESIADRMFKKLIEMGQEATKQKIAWNGQDISCPSLPGKTKNKKKKKKIQGNIRKNCNTKDPPVSQREKQPQPQKFFEVTVCPGDWNGFGPKRSNCEFPRKELLRKVRRLVRDYASSGKAMSTGLIIGWEPVNEYRSSLQTPQPLPLVLGYRIDRFNPPSGEKDSDAKFKNVSEHRPWKLLYCPYTKTLVQRDVSAAWAIALQYAFKKVARERGFSEDEFILPGYKRLGTKV